MPNDENKPAPEVRQPVAHEIGANFEGRGNLSASVGLAQAVAATFEGRGNLSASVGLAQAVAATFEGRGNLSAVVERGWFEWHPLVDDIKRGRPSPARLFRDEAQRQLASRELPPTKTLNAFARDLLVDWFPRAHPDVRSPRSVRVVERYVRKLWRAAGRT